VPLRYCSRCRLLLDQQRGVLDWNKKRNEGMEKETLEKNENAQTENKGG